MSAPGVPPVDDTCGCCEGIEVRTPAAHINRPGLPTLAYRIGTHSSFKETMQALLSRWAPLRALRTREDDDPSLALIDAWATVADVLTFYQERIANEGYLRTATERRSVLELARAIGYELNPGVAASALLAFTVEDAPSQLNAATVAQTTSSTLGQAVEDEAGAPSSSTVPLRTRVQSIPAQGKLPQTFETIEAIQAHAEWNVLRPRLTQPQKLVIEGGALKLVALDNTRIAAQQLYLAGTATNLKAGDLLLVAVPTSTGTFQTLAVAARGVVAEPDQDRTRVVLGATVAPPTVPPVSPPTLPEYDTPPTVAEPPLALTRTALDTYILQRRWREADLRAFLTAQGWSPRTVAKAVNQRIAASAPPPLEGVFAFRTRLGFFGHNAPRHASLPKQGSVLRGDPYPYDWDADSGWPIWKDPNPTLADPLPKSLPAAPDWSGASAYLERVVQGMVGNTWAVFELPTAQYTLFRVAAVNETSLASFSVSGKATGLSLTDPADGSALTSSDKRADLTVRKTTAHVQSERLGLADLPIQEAIAAQAGGVVLGGLVLRLQIGQQLILSGVRVDLPGVTASEVVTLSQIIHDHGYTTLYFQAKLHYDYVRATVTLTGNIARATHGETAREPLGSGNGAQPNQRFTLKKRPLTYVAASTPSGGRSTLEVRVDGVLWQEAPSLYPLDPRSQNYIIRIDDGGAARVIFGDGRRGARLPTGQENVVATYRSGTGPDGEVSAGSLTLLQTRPLGIRGVTNPLPAGGAAAPETLDAARTNAPLTVLTLDRIVSLRDFEDFARAFAGIGKAQATLLWNGQTRLVQVTIASASGTPVETSAALYTNLRRAMDAARDPLQHLEIVSFRPRTFSLDAAVRIDPRYVPATVLAQVASALQAAFAFAARAFSQPVTAAEVITTMQNVPGVVAVDLNTLTLDGATPPAQQPLALLPADIARSGQGAELLLINPGGIKLKEMTV